MIFVKDSVRTEIIFIKGKDGRIDSVFVKTDCPPQTAEKEVATGISNTISAGKGFWYYLWRGLGLSVLAFIAGYVVRAMAKKQVNINIGKENTDL